MINTDILPEAVQWSEGMLLSPQHFQQNDIHAQAMLHQRLFGLCPHAWGVRHLQLDAARLADGFINVTECDAVMPDGLPLVFRAAGATHGLSLDLAAKCTADGRSVRVCLALPPRVRAADVPASSIRRYESVHGKETPDEVTGIGDVVVDRQRARIELFVQAEVPAGYVALPLLEVARDPQGAIALGSFHPPMFRLGASAFLGARGLQQQFAALRDSMWTKLRELVASGCDDAPEAVAMMGVEARMHLRVAREVAACLPLIDTVLVDPLCAPVQAWHAMAQIVGRMAALGGNPRPLAMEPYRHADCHPQFQAALDFVAAKLALINTDWDSMAFARVSDGMFARRLPENSPRSVYVELRAREGQTGRELQSWLREARIASDELLPMLRQRRLLGSASRTLTSREVAELGLRADALICELTSQQVEVPQTGMVESFQPGRSIVVQGDSAHAPAAIVLHHRKRTRSATHPASPADASHHA